MSGAGVMKYYGYFRSSAAFRLRIGLALKGLEAEFVAIHLRAGDQRQPEFLKVNPQGLVPVLEHDGKVFNQSLAILEYLDEAYPEPPLVPGNAAKKAKIRAIALTIACDIHPLNNTRVLQYLGRELGADEDVRNSWYRHWVGLGFEAIEPVISAEHGFCFGDSPTLADVCLIPQVANANRFDCDLAPFPKIRAVNEHALTLPAFAQAVPALQPDAE
jgi:maleylacetoacetate isomerase